jgi:hypothetical protein
MGWDWAIRKEIVMEIVCRSGKGWAVWETDGWIDKRVGMGRGVARLFPTKASHPPTHTHILTCHRRKQRPRKT